MTTIRKDTTKPTKYDEVTIINSASKDNNVDRDVNKDISGNDDIYEEVNDHDNENA